MTTVDPMAVAARAEPCVACKLPVVWVLDAQMKRVAVDVEPTPGGTLSLSVAWDDSLRAHAPTAKLAFGRSLRAPHMKTCPKVGQLKKARSS